MCVRTDHLTDVFDNEQQSMLIWTSVPLPVVDGANTTRIMHRDVLGTLSKFAPPGTYSFSDVQSVPCDDSPGLPEKSDKGPAFVVSDEFANLQWETNVSALPVLDRLMDCPFDNPVQIPILLLDTRMAALICNAIARQPVICVCVRRMIQSQYVPILRRICSLGVCTQKFEDRVRLKVLSGVRMHVRH